MGWKYACLSGNQVIEDLSINHGLQISKRKLQTVNESLGSVLADKEAKWSYTNPVLSQQVYSVGISRDGTTTPIKGEGYKETMTGTISLYNQEGERLHTIYTACSPEHGKATFDYVFSQQINQIKGQYKTATYIAIADGARDNWSFLQQYASIQTIDYWHVCEYLAEYSKVAYKSKEQRVKWMEQSCYQLKHHNRGADKLLEEMREYGRTHCLLNQVNPVSKAVTYFENNKMKMLYASNLKRNLPIGSGGGRSCLQNPC